MSPEVDILTISRSVYKSRYRLSTPDFGSQFPKITVYAVISESSVQDLFLALSYHPLTEVLGYCVISPIINGFGACFFIVSALVFKYRFIWVGETPVEKDTGGLFFPKAVTHVFVGIYIQEVCLCALFFLARNENLKVAAIPQAVLMIILIVLTVSKPPCKNIWMPC